MNWISRILCFLGLHGPARLGETSQYRSNIPSEMFPRNPRNFRTCECCGARWKKTVVAAKYPFKWIRMD